jgi:hypothetical protein
MAKRGIRGKRSGNVPETKREDERWMQRKKAAKSGRGGRRLIPEGTGTSPEDRPDKSPSRKEATEISPAGTVGTSRGGGMVAPKASPAADRKKGEKEAAAADKASGGAGTERDLPREGADVGEQNLGAMGKDAVKKATLPYDLDQEGQPKADEAGTPVRVSRPAAPATPTVNTDALLGVGSIAPTAVRHVFCPGQNHMVHPSTMVDVIHPQTSMSLCSECAGVPGSREDTGPMESPDQRDFQKHVDESNVRSAAFDAEIATREKEQQSGTFVLEDAARRLASAKPDL